MKSWVLAVSLLAAAFVPTGAIAADVDDDDDKRGTYTEPRRKGPPGPPPAYNDREDDDDDRPPAKKFSGPPPGNKYSGPPSAQNCARSEQVRQRLVEMGWQDFQGGRQEGDMVVMKARRPNGRLFELTLHRCSGQVAEVRPLEGRPAGGGPYAFNRPYNDDRYDAAPPRGGYGYDDRWRDRPYAGGGPRRWWWRD